MTRTNCFLTAAAVAAAVAAPAAAQQRGGVPSGAVPQVTVGPVTVGVGPGGVTVNPAGAARTAIPGGTGYGYQNGYGPQYGYGSQYGVRSGYMPQTGYGLPNGAGLLYGSGGYAPGAYQPVYGTGMPPARPAGQAYQYGQTYPYGSGANPAYPGVPAAVTPAPAYPAAPVTYGVPAPAPVAETGLRIDELADGPAKAAGLRAGDVILSAGGVRTRTHADIRNTLTQVADGMAVEVEYRDAVTGAVGRRPVAVNGGRIGVTVAEVTVPDARSTR